MANIRNGFGKFWADESGQSTTEYILILAVVVMIAMKFKNMFGKKIEDMVGGLGGKLGEFERE